MAQTSGSPKSLISIPDLPDDIFVIIIKYLETWDMVRCRQVSKIWQAAFTKTEYLKIMIRDHHLAREIRKLPCDDSEMHEVYFKRLFDRLASRYYHLTHGKARSIERYKLAASEQFSHWYPVSQWDYHESQPGGRLYYQDATHISRLGSKTYLFRPTFWTYDDGLLVYAPRRASEEVEAVPALLLRDIDSGKAVPINFSISGKVIRNLRLKDRTLVVEWAEKEPFHALNDSEKVHRHFASCFDVRKNGDEKEKQPWMVEFRNEWKLHFLGLPLSHKDRFFSNHNSQHYAIYHWQPNRSMYTGDDESPIESLLVFDISSASSYLPSKDPSGSKRTHSLPGARVISRFSFRDLAHLNIRQGASISLMSIQLDSASSSLIFKENKSVAGQGYFDPAQRLWCSTTTLFPFVGHGPHLRREWENSLPSYRGHTSMESTEIEEPDNPYISPIMDVVDAEARVRFSLAETCFTGQFVENKIVLNVTTVDENGDAVVCAMEDRFTREVAQMGRVAGDERYLVGQNESAEIVVLKF